MKITVFNAKKTQGKYPYSPFNNDTFFFETKNVESIKEVFTYLQSNFILNIPLTRNIKESRLKSSLQKYFQPKLDYLLIDVDHIETISDRNLVINRFKELDYKIILGASRSDYNLKGVMKISKQTIKEAKALLYSMADDFKERGLPQLDKGSISQAGFQAPVMKYQILYDGGTMVAPVGKPPVQKIQTIVEDKTVQSLCMHSFAQKGYTFTPSDNGFRCKHISEKKTPNGFSWNPEYPFHMGHWNPARNDSVWEEVIKMPQYKAIQNLESKERVQSLFQDSKYPAINKNKRYLKGCPDEVKKFIESKNSLLCIESPMGTGKSRIIEEVIHQARKNNQRILFLVNRISLADDVHDKYQDIKHYLGSDVEENSYKIGDDLVVQIDSLHKFSTKYFDIIIMDEVATTLFHLLSLENHKAKITKKIFSGKKRVIADAFIFDEFIEVFEHKEGIKIQNQYRDETDLTIFKQKDQFVETLINTAENEPVTFSSGSTKMLKIIQKMANLRNISTATISAETPKKRKELIYKSFKNKKKAIAQIIMYSPSLTVGISNENDTRVHFHYDSGMSMNVLQSTQMIKRTRNADRINLFLGCRQKYEPVDSSVIQQKLDEFINLDEDGDSTGIDQKGVKLGRIQKLYNILENRHKLSFILLLSKQFNKLPNVNKTTTPKFLYQLSKEIDAEQIKANTEVLDWYLEKRKNSPEEVYAILDLPYGETRKEVFIKELDDMYHLLSMLDEKNKIDLMKLEVQKPGSIEQYEALLNMKVNNTKIPKTLTIKEAENITPKKLGYHKVRNIWVLDAIFCDIFGI